MYHSRSQRRRPALLGAAAFTAFALVATACGSDDDDSGSGDTAAPAATEAGSAEPAEEEMDERSINVAIVGNPQMEDIASLTPELFTADTGIEVNYTILEEQTLREIVTRDVGAGGEQFDVVMIGMFEAPQFGANGWLNDLNTFAADTPEWNGDDIIPAVRGGLSFEGSLYAAPFYAESSFVMYRAGPARGRRPDDARRPDVGRGRGDRPAVDSDDVAGICLRGKPGWGDLGAAFTTVLNTFGGTWWLANDDGSIGAAQVDQPEFREALEFYVGLLNDAGEDDAANASFNECLALYQEGKVAMWYDATVAAGILEADDSPVKGLNGFALAPTKVTDASGWLWSWALAIPQNAPDAARRGSTSAGPPARTTSTPPAPRCPVDGPPCRPARVCRPTRTPTTRRRGGLRRQDARRDAGRTDRQPGDDTTPGPPRRAVRRRARVPGHRNALHRAVLGGDRRQHQHRRRPERLPGHRLGVQQLTTVVS